MTSQGQDWNELHLSEDPAVELLQALGYTYVAPEVLEAERDSLKESILAKRLAKALERLNPWLSDDNTHKAIRAVTTVQASNLLDASEEVHTALTYGISLKQDLGAGKQGQTVRFFDFEKPLPELRIVGNSLDALFERMFAERTKEERNAIKKKYANEAAIAGALKRIEAICLDLITRKGNGGCASWGRD